jgi:hypothetical protein
MDPSSFCAVGATWLDGGATLLRVQEAFGNVLFAVVILGGIAAIVGIMGTGKLYKEIGKGGLFEDEAARKANAGGAAPPMNVQERDEEIRQMLTARNARHARTGGAQVDIEDELASLTRPAVDPELEAEVRAFVLARNERRIEKGQDPVDVESEVARRLSEFG